MYYTIDIAGMKRDLKLFPVNDDLKIAAFILFGDVEITKHAAKELLARARRAGDEAPAELRSTLDAEVQRLAQGTLRQHVRELQGRNVTDWGKIKQALRENLSSYIWQRTKRRPMILPVIMEV